MTTRAKTIQVSRVRLIERLQARAAENEVLFADRFAAALAEQVKAAEREVRSAERKLGDLKKVKGPEDTAGEYWARPFREDGELGKQIILLELSDDETIAVGPTSDLAKYL